MTNNSVSQRGFSLIELLIVISVIAIIAAIAIPYLMAAKQASNSASAIASLRVINQCEISYRATTGSYGTATELATSGFLSDPDIPTGEKSRYQFSVTPDSATPSLDYTAEAVPLDIPVTLWYHYFVNATGVIRKNQGARATTTSPPID